MHEACSIRITQNQPLPSLNFKLDWFQDGKCIGVVAGGKRILCDYLVLPDTLTPDTIIPSTLLQVYYYSGYNPSFNPSPISIYSLTPDTILPSTFLRVFSYSGYNTSFNLSPGILVLRIQYFLQPFSGYSRTPDTFLPSTLLQVYSYSVTILPSILLQVFSYSG